VWVSVYGEGGVHTSVALASTVLWGNRYWVYRARDGRSCAVGYLMPVDVYDADFEGLRIDTLSFMLCWHWRGVRLAHFAIQHETLLQNLQNVHDGSIPATWADGLRLVAMQFGLSDRMIGEHEHACALLLIKPVLYLVARAENVIRELEAA